MKNKIKHILTSITILLFVTICYGIDENRMSNILFADPCKYNEISKEDAQWILTIDPDTTILFLHNSIDYYNKKNFYPSQHAILILGMFGTLKDTSIISYTLARKNACSLELPPCEYYCAYNTANTLLKIRFLNETPSIKPSWPQWSKNVNIKSIQNELNNFTEEIIAKSIFDTSIRIKLPPEVNKQLSDSQKDSFYEFSIYYNLFERGHTIIAIKLLFEQLLYLYGRDASGDGGVSDIEMVIYKMTYRIIKN